MIRIDLLQAREDMLIGKYFFLRDAVYYSRKSKRGDTLLIRDENERWYPAIRYGYANMFVKKGDVTRGFRPLKTIFVDNYEEAKFITG